VTHPAVTKMFLRASVRHCPWCGQGKLFRTWFRPVRRCPRCGLVIERGEGAMLGSMSINMGVTMVVLVAFIVGWLAIDMPDVQMAKAIVAAGAVAIAVPLAFFPFSKTIWAAIDIWFHGFDIEYVDPDEARRLQRGE
jgi:uncharacterized protein (DUF983 family)